MWRGIALCIGAAPMQWCFTFLIRFFKRFKKEEEEGKLQKCKTVQECAQMQKCKEVHIAASRGFNQKGAAATLFDFKEVEEAWQELWSKIDNKKNGIII